MSISMASSEQKPEYGSVNEQAVLKPSGQRRNRILTIALVAAVLGIVSVAGTLFRPATTPVMPRKQLSIQSPLDNAAKTALGKLAQCQVKYVVLVVEYSSGSRSRFITKANKAPASSTCVMTIDEVATMLATNYSKQRAVVATSVKCDANANVVKKAAIIWNVYTPEPSYLSTDMARANGEVARFILDNSINGFQAEDLIGGGSASQLKLQLTMKLGCTTSAPVPSPTANPITYTRANSVQAVRSYNQKCSSVCRVQGKYAAQSDTGISMCSANVGGGLIVTGYQKDTERTCMVGKPRNVLQASTSFSCLCSSDLPGFAFGEKSGQKDCAAKCDAYRRRAVDTGIFRGTKIYSCIGTGNNAIKGGYNLAGQDTCYVEATLNKVGAVTSFGCLCQ